MRVGVLTGGGDCPGLNAVIRGVAKAAMHHGIRVVGIRDGFRGLVENRTMELTNGMMSGILTQGGTQGVAVVAIRLDVFYTAAQFMLGLAMEQRNCMPLPQQFRDQGTADEARAADNQTLH